jgi:cation diffusion facilitator family transporter
LLFRQYYERKEKGSIAWSSMRAGFVYLFISIIVFLLKAFAAYLTKSSALFSDALETLVNIAASIISLGVLKFVSQPKDDNHPYGHGKAEFISSAVEGGFVLSAALAILSESISSLFNQHVVIFDQTALFVSIGASALNVLLYFYLKWAAKNKNLLMLNSSASHVISDVWTTIGVLLALGITKITGFNWLDSLVAIVISTFLFYEGFKILRESFSGLTDELDQKILVELSAAFKKVAYEIKLPGFIDVHAVRFIRSGHFHHVDAHLVVPRYWDISKAHEFTGELEKYVVEAYRFDGEIAFHIDPCEAHDCEYCDLEKCPVRSEHFKNRKSFIPEQVAAKKNNLSSQ